MRYAILADIHSNLKAFEAVLEDIERRGGAVEIWCLGDVVGYGPDPRECLHLLQQYPHCCIAGNHDWAAIGKIDTSDFNPEAAAACHWTASQLSREDINYLENLPLILYRDDFTLAHGSPREPIWEYLLSVQSAKANFSYFKTKYCLIGHSHVPLLFEERADACQLSDLPAALALDQRENRLIINPGGVGQPRDNDNRASYVILDAEEGVLCHYRVAYDISATQDKMIKSGLPRRLAARLSYGW
jgi:predicted phosphodiesterase